MQTALSANGSNVLLVRVFTIITQVLRPEDLPRTRLVITGDFIASVNSRENRSENTFMMERGSGVVAAKTMPPNQAGVVEILMPACWFLPEQTDAATQTLIEHLAAHEAVHATLHHVGNEPFDVHKREELGYAALQFAAMASEQVEEHLAEYLSNQVARSPIGATADQVKQAFEAWQTHSQ